MGEHETLPKLPPPQAPFQSVASFFERLKDTVVPNRIDRSMMKNLSGTGQTALMQALRFLRLISEDGAVKPALATIVEAHDTPEWPQKFAPIVTAAYRDLVGGVDIAKATARQVAEAFRAAGAADGQALEKSIRFWRNALESAQIKFSPLIAERKPRVVTGAKRGANSGAIGGGAPGNTDADYQWNGAGTNGQRSGKAAERAGGAPPPPPPNPGLHKWPVFIPNKMEGWITLPVDITAEDLVILDAVVAGIHAYAKLRTGREKEASA